MKNKCEVPLCSVIDLPIVGEPSGDPSTTQNMEIVNMICKGMDKTDFLDARIVNATRYLLKYGYQVGQGLGAQGQEQPQPVLILIKGQTDKSSLGYQGIKKHDYMMSLSFCHDYGFTHISELFVLSGQGTME